jgi:hypothetical protein
MHKAQKEQTEDWSEGLYTSLIYKQFDFFLTVNIMQQCSLVYHSIYTGIPWFMLLIWGHKIKTAEAKTA